LNNKYPKCNDQGSWNKYRTFRAVGFSSAFRVEQHTVQRICESLPVCVVHIAVAFRNIGMVHAGFGLYSGIGD